MSISILRQSRILRTEARDAFGVVPEADEIEAFVMSCTVFAPGMGTIVGHIRGNVIAEHWQVESIGSKFW